MSISIIWVEVYRIEADLLMAMPVRISEPLRKEIERHRIREVTEAEAREMNERLCAQSPINREFIEKDLAARWAILKEQGYTP